MTANEVLLQRDDVAMTDACFGKSPKTGVDAIHRRRCITSVHNGVDCTSSRFDSTASFRAEHNGTTSTRDVFEVLEGHETTEFYRGLCVHERNASRPCT